MKYIIIVIALLAPFTSFGQTGPTIDFSDTSVLWKGVFSQTPIYRTRDRTGYVKAGFFRIYTPFLLDSAKANSDSAFTLNNLITANDSGKLIRVNYNRIFTQALEDSVISWVDLSSKLNISDTTNKWQPKGNYLSSGDTTGKFAPKLNYLLSEVDGSTTNELQTLSIGNDTIFLTNGSFVKLPARKRQETYTGTTNSSGTYTVTYGAAYSATPDVQFNIVGGAVTNTIRLTSSSTTGFTVYVQNRVDVVGLLPSYTNVNGATISILVTER